MAGRFRLMPDGLRSRQPPVCGTLHFSPIENTEEKKYNIPKKIKKIKKNRTEPNKTGKYLH